jgi:hypothetical protein
MVLKATFQMLASICFALVLPFVGKASGYGFLGHELVATVVWRHLDPASRLRLEQFVPSERHFCWLSTLPDSLKSRPDWQWTKRMHFLNTDSRRDRPPRQCEIPARSQLTPPRLNLIEACEQWTRVLQTALQTALKGADPSSPEHRLQVALGLAFVTHLVVDLHQPLHLTKWQRGGLHTRVHYGGRRTSLHFLWDTAMLKELVHRHHGRHGLLKRIEREMIHDMLFNNHPQIHHRHYLHNQQHISQSHFWHWARDINACNCRTVFRRPFNARRHEALLIRLLAQAATRTKLLLQDIVDSIKW